MRIAGIICYVLGTLDVLLNNVFDIDVTGVIWSPIVAYVLGSILFALGNKNEEE